MAENSHATSPDSLATRVLPWLPGGLMLVVYGLTLNHWVTPASLGLAANLEGLNWSPSLFGPVTWLLTWPLGQLPPAWIPPAANLLTAVCAAISLAWLARCAALLPHNQTEPRRARRRHRRVLPVAIPCAWLPPLLAVLVCGLELSFWENAVAATGAMVNLLMFAYVIRTLLEYSMSRQNTWLLRGAFVCGLAVANDGTMAAFLPALAVTLVWQKRLFFFTERFLKRLLRHPRSFRWQLLWQLPGCFAAGWSLVLLLPALAALSPAAHLGFWAALKFSLHTYRQSLASLPEDLLVASCLTSVLPIAYVGIRFYDFAAGANRFNLLVARVMFHLVHVFLFLASLWTMFDSPISPRELHLGVICLPLYFLGALSVGFFCGHLLLVAEIKAEPPAARRRRRRTVPSSAQRRRRQQERLVRLLKRGVATATGVVSVTAPVWLAAKNLPEILAQHSGPAAAKVRLLSECLPETGAVVLAKDPQQVLYLEAELIRQDRQISYLVLDLNELTQNPDYLAFLARSNPGFNLDLPGTDWSTPERSKVTVMRFLQQLSQTYEIYCLPPPPLTDLVAEYCSFEPHGLVCRLEPYSANSAFADPWADSVVMENEEFWRRFENQLLPVLQARLRASQPTANASPAREYLHYLGWPPSPGPEAAETAAGYAAVLNDWGVALQRLGRFSEAASCFRTALDLNPQNPAAQINQKFNSGYLTNRAVTMQKPLEVARSVTEFRDWEHVLRAGLVDEPNFCNLLGTVMEANNLFRPAIAEYERVLALSPARTDTQLSLARLFLECHDLTNALAETDRILLNSPANQAALNLRAQALMQEQAFDRALIPLTTLLADQPANPSLRLSRAIALYKTGRLAAAREDYQAALQLGGHPFQAYLGLAEIARQSNEAAVAITNYELFIRYAPADTLELEEAQNHLKELKAAGAQ